MSESSASLNCGMKRFMPFYRKDPVNSHRRTRNDWRGRQGAFSPDSAQL